MIKDENFEKAYQAMLSDTGFNFEWMNEKIDHLPKNNWIYKFFCFFIGRKMNFAEYFIVICKINDSKMENIEVKKRCLLETLKVYEYQNNKLPDEILKFNEN